MTELLTKEKQFLKLNEQLNRMAVTNGEREDSTTDARFLTYQKTKGPSTLLRKQGAGDGFTEIHNNKNNNNNNSKPQRPNSLPLNKTPGGETYRSNNKHHHYANITSTSPTQDPNQYRSKSLKCNETNRSHTSNRLSNSRVTAASPGPPSSFTIKYRNPKFLESPSLDVLVKEESSSLRCQKEASRIGSVNSIAVEESTSSGRCSRSSNHTMASKKNISSEGLIKFLKSKIIILEEDHERLTQEMVKQKDLLNKALDQTKTLEQQRDQAYNKNTNLKDQLAKHEKQLEEANRRLKERSLEQTAQNKELETAKRELKLLTQTNNNLEKRLFRANEELESMRNTLSEMKNAEREQQEAMRVEAETKDKQIKSLKKQRADLLNAYKKQLYLIDNLKRQNVCLEQAKMLEFEEKEFAKVLEWNRNM